MSEFSTSEEVTTIEDAMHMICNIGGYLNEIPPRFWTREVLLKAVTIFPRQLQLCASAGLATDEICLTAINASPGAILDCPELKKDLCLVAIEHYPPLITSVLNSPKYNGDAATTAELALVAVSKYGPCLNNSRIVQTPKLCMLAVTQDPMTIRFVNKQTWGLCMAAIKSNPLAIQYVRNQTHELCEIALSMNGMAIRYIHKQSHVLCRLALKQNWNSMQVIKNKDQNMRLEAVRQNGYVIRWMDDVRIARDHKSRRLLMTAVEQNGDALKYVYWRNNTASMSFERQLCLTAVRRCSTAFAYIPLKQLRKYVSGVIVIEKLGALAALRLSAALMCEIGLLVASWLATLDPLVKERASVALRWGELWQLAAAMRRMV